MQRPVADLKSSWTWIETNGFLSLDWVRTDLWKCFDTVSDRSLGCDQAAGAGLLGSLPSWSLGRPVPTEILLRPSRSDASNVSPSKNAASLFLQGHTCSVAFLRFHIYLYVYLYCRFSTQVNRNHHSLYLLLWHFWQVLLLGDQNSCLFLNWGLLDIW